MKKYAHWALALLTSAALALPLAAQAQPPAAGASAAKHARQKPAAKKPVRKTKKGVPLKTAKAVETQTPVQTLTERLTDAELQTAQQVYTGTFPCELGEQVTVTADASHPGFFTVMSGKRRYYMHPVESRTGAIRMEDNFHSAVWLQLGSKSMLMDQKAGQRVADDCKAAAQQNYAAYLRDHPQPRLLDQQSQQAPAGPASAPASSEQSAGAPVSGGAQPADSASNNPQPPGSAASAPASSENPPAAPAGGEQPPATQTP